MLTACRGRCPRHTHSRIYCNVRLEADRSIEWCPVRRITGHPLDMEVGCSSSSHGDGPQHARLSVFVAAVEARRSYRRSAIVLSLANQNNETFVRGCSCVAMLSRCVGEEVGVYGLRFFPSAVDKGKKSISTFGCHGLNGAAALSHHHDSAE